MTYLRKFIENYPFYVVKKLVAKFIEYNNSIYLIGVNSIELISNHEGMKIII